MIVESCDSDKWERKKYYSTARGRPKSPLLKAVSSSAIFSAPRDYRRSRLLYLEEACNGLGSSTNFKYVETGEAVLALIQNCLS